MVKVRRAAMASHNNPMLPGDYPRLVSTIQEVVAAYVPARETVIVVSKGDDELLRLGDRAAWHFPQAADGNYAGHHPADSQVAVRQLEELRAKGGRFLLFPSTAFWWLDHYPSFRKRLDDRYHRLHED